MELLPRITKSVIIVNIVNIPGSNNQYHDLIYPVAVTDINIINNITYIVYTTNKIFSTLLNWLNSSVNFHINYYIIIFFFKKSDIILPRYTEILYKINRNFINSDITSVYRFDIPKFEKSRNVWPILFNITNSII